MTKPHTVFIKEVWAFFFEENTGQLGLTGQTVTVLITEYELYKGTYIKLIITHRQDSYCRLTWNFCRISNVDLWNHSSMLISGCCSRSEAFGVLVWRFTFECLGNSSSSKLLNSGILPRGRYYGKRKWIMNLLHALETVKAISFHGLSKCTILNKGEEENKWCKWRLLTQLHWHVGNPIAPP